MKCRRCGTETSVFWWPLRYETVRLDLCDKCHWEFLQFMNEGGKE